VLAGTTRSELADLVAAIASTGKFRHVGLVEQGGTG